MRAEMKEAHEAFKTKCPPPEDDEAYNQWRSLPEVRRYHRMQTERWIESIKPMASEPGTLGAEFREALEACKTKLPAPKGRVAYEQWCSLPEVRRYRHLKFVMQFIAESHLTLPTREIWGLKRDDVIKRDPESGRSWITKRPS